MTEKDEERAERGFDSLVRTTKNLSLMLEAEVCGMRARQQAALAEGAADKDAMKGMKEATAVLKDLAAVTKSLSDQDDDGESEGGVILLPAVEVE